MVSSAALLFSAIVYQGVLLAWKSNQCLQTTAQFVKWQHLVIPYFSECAR